MRETAESNRAPGAFLPIRLPVASEIPGDVDDDDALVSPEQKQ
jgi:hypothetical protein